MLSARFAKGKLQKGLRDDVFIFQAFCCGYSALLRCGAVLRSARVSAYTVAS